MPDTNVVQQMVTKHGNNLFYRDVNLRLLCCQVRKVLPLRRALMNYSAWVTGLRRDQWATRSNIRKIEIDHDHGGIVKLAPLADWTEEEVWDYIRANDVPYNELYDKGYKSIGCAPCTRAVGEGEDARSGRWWWETGAPKECGMHCAIETGGFEHELAALLGKTTGHEVVDAMASDRPALAGESITLDTLQRDILFPQVQAFLDATTRSASARGLSSLKSAIEALEVPPNLQRGWARSSR